MRKNQLFVCFLMLLSIFVLAIGARSQQKPAGSKPAAAVKGNPAASARNVAAAAQEKSAASDDRLARLPVRRVVLYKNGIGYFEHLGRVRGSQDVTIDFTSGQLNDVLKSLTVLDLSGGRIAGVDYNSEAPLSKRLGTLRLSLGERPSVAEFLGALRGARLEVRAGGGTVAGRLLSVEKKTHMTKSGETSEALQISLITDAGEMRTLDVDSAAGVRIAERDLNGEVSRYLGLLASSREQDLRRMTISTAGAGERNLYVSYISEVPIWKTTYRIVLPTKAGKSPLLQGWAIVDNTVGEDWSDVELSLVAGAPHSFIQQLSQPYYGRRPVVPLPESVQLTPQTHSATLETGASQLTGEVTDPSGAVISDAAVRVLDQNNRVVAETTTNDDGEYTVEDLPVGNYHVEVEKAGFQKMVFSNFNAQYGQNSLDAKLNVGATSETIEVQAAAPVKALPKMSRGVGGRGYGVAGGAVADFSLAMPGAPQPANVAAAREAVQAGARGQELGDLFEYKLKERVTIRKNQSALVPIVQTDITADKVSLWSQSLGTARPLRALWVTNSSALTLDGGSFSVLEDETFAGEGLLDPIKPSEKRLLSYATDLGLLVDTKLESEQQRVTRVRLIHGLMIHTSQLREKKTYTVRNEDTSPRALVIEHPARPEWRLADDAPKPEEKAAGLYRFRFTIEPKKTEKLVINEARPLETSYALNSVTDDQVAFFLRQKSINAEVEMALREILAQKNVIVSFDSRIQARQKEVDQIFTDQQRLRENMKALKGSAEERALTQRYTQQLADQETRLDALRKEMADLGSQRRDAQSKLDRMIQQLALDVTL